MSLPHASQAAAPRPRHRLAAGLPAALLLAAAAVEGAVQVKLEGLDGDQTRNVEAFLSIYRERETDKLTEGRVKRLHERAPEQIKEALAPFGLYRVTVQDTLAQTPEGNWVATYRITAGEPIPLGKVDVRVTGEGASEPDRPDLGLNAGAPFTHTAYESAKST